MNEQRNLYLAIGISIAIIIFFQLLFPTQPIQTTSFEEDEVLEPATSIDGQSSQAVSEIQSRDEALIQTDRVIFENASIKGSINLKGAILDDLILSKYKTSLEPDSIISSFCYRMGLLIHIILKRVGKNKKNLEFYYQI